MDERTCAECENELAPVLTGRPRVYCSDRCRSRAVERKRQRRVRGIDRCAWCFHEYERRGHHQRTCSQQCAKNLRREGWAEPIAWRECRCGRWFVGNRKLVHCSPDCPAIVRHVAKGTPTTAMCKHCGMAWDQEATGGRPRSTCVGCARDISRASGGRRRRRIRAARREIVIRRKVYERDNWRCHLCGTQVDKTKQVPHPKAPTIDHVVPVSEGGEHSYANVRCCHFLCNSRKGSRTTERGEQLRLIG